MPGNALLRLPELTSDQVALVTWMVSTPDGRRFLEHVIADARGAERGVDRRAEPCAHEACASSPAESP
jgi:hypothetical protein